MAGFRKAKCEQAALKIGMYGLPGSGKTFTALLIAESLAKITGKRIAYVDTENGTHFYSMNVPERKVHPEAFDFDALYTRSITEVLKEVKSLNVNDYSVLIIDSITHIWEAAQNAYSGRMTNAGTIPFHAWGKIKKPYKELINYLLSSPMHVIFCGRQGNEFSNDEETGELIKTGYKMKSEGETPYEPNILIHMESVKQGVGHPSIITAYAEKDRTGVLAGRTIEWPSFENIVKPLLPLLGEKQAHVISDTEAALQDAETLSEEETVKEAKSAETLKKYKARFTMCDTLKDIKEIGKEITKELKATMTSQHVAELRECYLESESKLK